MATIRGSWNDLYIETFCADSEGLHSLRLYGRGISIWDQRRQKVTEPEALQAIQATLLSSEFWNWEPVYGGEARAAVRIRCQVQVDLGSVSKRVSQREKGQQFGPLRELAFKILELASSSEPGVGAEDLGDGLAKLSSGTLAPEALQLLFHERRGPVGSGTGTILRVAGRRLVVEQYEGATRRETRSELADGEFLRLASALERASADSMPPNLYSDVYVDLRLEILDQKKVIQARQFAGLTPTTHGASQERLDELLEFLRQTAGRPTAGQ